MVTSAKMWRKNGHVVFSDFLHKYYLHNLTKNNLREEPKNHSFNASKYLPYDLQVLQPCENLQKYIDLNENFKSGQILLAQDCSYCYNKWLLKWTVLLENSRTWKIKILPLEYTRLLSSVLTTLFPFLLYPAISPVNLLATTLSLSAVNLVLCSISRNQSTPFSYFWSSTLYGNGEICYKNTFAEDRIMPVIAKVKVMNIPLVFEPPHDKINKMTVRPTKTQISLGICPVWSVLAVHSVGS